MKENSGMWGRASQALGAALVCAVVLAGCSSNDVKPDATPTPEASKPAPGPSYPDLPPKEAKAQAQKSSVEALELLQNGEEAKARDLLEEAIYYDASNELARKMLDQITADAQTELGSVYFKYAVQSDDSLSKIAQRFLNDKFKFWILAKYNDISNPSRLSSGQVIKVPGKNAPPPPPPVKGTTKPEATAKTPDAPPPPPPPPVDNRKDADKFYMLALGQQRSGSLEAAYGSAGEALRRDPSHTEAGQLRENIRRELVKRYNREANGAFQKQNLDLAIARWSQVLQYEPGNELAKLNRARAIDLKIRINKLNSPAK